MFEVGEFVKMPYVTSFERMAEERGEKRGKIKGQSETLLKLIQVKFGPPDPELKKKILAATPEQPDLWVERILTANRIEDLFV